MEMHGWMLRCLLNALAVLLMIFLIPETFTPEGTLISGFTATPWGALIGALLLGVLNSVIRPLLQIIRLPFNYINISVVTIVFNSLFMYLTVSTIKGFELGGWAWSLLAVVLLSLVSIIISMLIADEEFGFGR